jgi:hypothetical protein
MRKSSPFLFRLWGEPIQMMLIRSFESESEVVKERISVTPQKEYHDRKDARAGMGGKPRGP